MEKNQKKLWDKLLKAWDDNNTMLHHHYSREYTQIYPNDMYGWIALADILTSMALYSDAKKSLNKSLSICPKGKEYQVYEQFGHFYKAKKSPGIAEKWYRRSVDEHERQTNLIFLGALLAGQGRFNEAKKYHYKASKLNPESADEAYYNLGLINRAEGNYQEAITFFDKAISIDSDYEEALNDKKELIEYLKNIDNL